MHFGEIMRAIGGKVQKLGSILSDLEDHQLIQRRTIPVGETKFCFCITPLGLMFLETVKQ